MADIEIPDENLGSGVALVANAYNHALRKCAAAQAALDEWGPKRDALKIKYQSKLKEVDVKLKVDDVEGIDIDLEDPGSRPAKIVKKKKGSE